MRRLDVRSHYHASVPDPASCRVLPGRPAALGQSLCVGRFIARFFGKNASPDGSKIQPAGVVMSIVGAEIVLFRYGRFFV
jgi:hypothetical protein